MTRDYKSRPAPKRRSRGSFLLGLFFGFFLGIAIASGIAVYFFKTPVPFIDKQKHAEKAAAEANLKEAPKAADTKGGKPRFDFYRILPGHEEPVTDQQIRQAAKAAKAPKAGEAAKDVYFVQAGSFQNPADADNLKAKLALLGLECFVQPTDLAEKGTWYRVRLGPYQRIEEIERVRAQLTQSGVQTSLVRLKETPKGG